MPVKLNSSPEPVQNTAEKNATCTQPQQAPNPRQCSTSQSPSVTRACRPAAGPVDVPRFPAASGSVCQASCFCRSSAKTNPPSPATAHRSPIGFDRKSTAKADTRNGHLRPSCIARPSRLADRRKKRKRRAGHRRNDTEGETHDRIERDASRFPAGCGRCGRSAGHCRHAGGLQLERRRWRHEGERGNEWRRSLVQPGRNDGRRYRGGGFGCLGRGGHRAGRRARRYDAASREVRRDGRKRAAHRGHVRHRLPDAEGARRGRRRHLHRHHRRRTGVLQLPHQQPAVEGPGGRLWREHRLDGVAWREVFRRGGRLPWLGQVRLLPLVRGRQRQQLHRPHARKRSKAGRHRHDRHAGARPRCRERGGEGPLRRKARRQHPAGEREGGHPHVGRLCAKRGNHGGARMGPHVFPQQRRQRPRRRRVAHGHLRRSARRLARAVLPARGVLLRHRLLRRHEPDHPPRRSRAVGEPGRRTLHERRLRLLRAAVRGKRGAHASRVLPGDEQGRHRRVRRPHRLRGTAGRHGRSRRAMSRRQRLQGRHDQGAGRASRIGRGRFRGHRETVQRAVRQGRGRRLQQGCGGAGAHQDRTVLHLPPGHGVLDLHRRHRHEPQDGSRHGERRALSRACTLPAPTAATSIAKRTR